MTLLAIVFRSPDDAKAHQELITQGIKVLRDSASPNSEVTGGVLGPDSYLLTVNAEGVGSLIGFLLRPYVVQLRTTLSEGSEPLVTPEELQSLASSVRASL